MPQFRNSQERSSPIRPLLAGDILSGKRVAGFTWETPEGYDGASNHLDDQLLLDGDQELGSPPRRPVPQTAESAEPCGAVPPADLPTERIRAASAIDVDLPARVNHFVDLPDAQWRPLARPLFAAVHATGHRMWVAGGATRDLVTGASPEAVNDLDLSGTVPPGRFTDILYQTLRATGMSEFRMTVTPDSLVCAVVPPGTTTRLIEYRGLTQGGFAFPAVGSSLAEDAQYRDFSFNSLMYDVLDHRVLDPTGAGLEDLLGKVRRFVPSNVSPLPRTQAAIIVRAAKFALRWGPQLAVDFAPLHIWIQNLPTDLCQMLSEADWSGLTSEFARSVAGASADWQVGFANSLPEPGRKFVSTLIGQLA